MEAETKFDWKTLFGDKLLNKSDEIDTNDALDGIDHVLIYFSAHWCLPCRVFTPDFVEAYNALKGAGKNFEVVFASSDHNETAFNEYYETMPWLGMSFSEEAKKNALAENYSCNGIPSLVILDAKDASIISTKAVEGIRSPTYIEDFPYEPKPVYDIKEGMTGIQGGVSLLLVQNYADDSIKTKNTDMLIKFAKENKFLFHTYFTVNGGGQDMFIRHECDLEIHVQHPHPVEKQPDTSTAYLKKAGSKEKAVNWRCNHCRYPGEGVKEHYHCKDCQYDLCEMCILDLKTTIPDEAKEPVLICLDLPNKKYYMPIKPDVDEYNIKVMATNLKKGQLKGITLKSDREPDQA